MEATHGKIIGTVKQSSSSKYVQTLDVKVESGEPGVQQCLFLKVVQSID
jgi:hypothetical protein